MAVERDEFEYLSEQVAQLRALVAVLVAGGDSDISEEALFYLSREPLGRFGDFSYLLDLLRRRGKGQGRLSETVFRTRAELNATRERIDTLQQETHEWLALQSFGLDVSQVKVVRFVPVRVYTSQEDEEAVEALTTAARKVLEEFGFEVSDEFPPIRGSFFQKFFGKTKEIATQPEVKQRLDKLERAIELAHLEQRSAEVNVTQSQAVGNLLDRLKDVPMGALQVGTAFAVKYPTENGPMLLSKTLTQAEMLALENDQTILMSPHTAMETLARLCGGNQVPSAASVRPRTRKPASEDKYKLGKQEFDTPALPNPKDSDEK